MSEYFWWYSEIPDQATLRIIYGRQGNAEDPVVKSRTFQLMAKVARVVPDVVTSMSHSYIFSCFLHLCLCYIYLWLGMFYSMLCLNMFYLIRGLPVFRVPCA